MDAGRLPQPMTWLREVGCTHPREILVLRSGIDDDGESWMEYQVDGKRGHYATSVQPLRAGVWRDGFPWPRDGGRWRCCPIYWVAFTPVGTTGQLF